LSSKLNFYVTLVSTPLVILPAFLHRIMKWQLILLPSSPRVDESLDVFAHCYDLGVVVIVIVVIIVVVALNNK